MPRGGAHVPPAPAGCGGQAASRRNRARSVREPLALQFTVRRFARAHRLSALHQVPPVRLYRASPAFRAFASRAGPSPRAIAPPADPDSLRLATPGFPPPGNCRLTRSAAPKGSAGLRDNALARFGSTPRSPNQLLEVCATLDETGHQPARAQTPNSGIGSFFAGHASGCQSRGHRAAVS